MMRNVLCLDTGATYSFVAGSANDAMEKMRYTLGLADRSANNAVICETRSGRVLYMEHNGCTYSTVNDKE